MKFACENLERRSLLSVSLANLNQANLDQPRLAPELPELLPAVRGKGLNVLPPPSLPPSGPIDPVAEYEPMEGLSISWAGTSAQKSMLAQIARPCNG